MNVNTNQVVRWSVSGAEVNNRNRQSATENQDAATVSGVAVSARQDMGTEVLISLSGVQTSAADAPGEASQEEATLSDYLDSMRENVTDTMQKLREAMEAGEAIADAWRDKLTALRIAMRIASGNNVPMRDHRFLMDFDSSMYNDAIRMSLVSTNDDPRDYEALTEDPDDERSSAAVGDSGVSYDAAVAGSEPQVTESVDADF